MASRSTQVTGEGAPRPRPDIESGLMEAIRGGSCVAFVGAGFSAAAGLPSWQSLIGRLAEAVPPDHQDQVRAQVRALVDGRQVPSSRELEMAAQLLFDSLGEDQFCAELSRHLHQDPLPDTMRVRLKHLLGIPFRAIVTTNFDPLLQGRPPSPEVYRSLLRPHRPASPWRAAIARMALDLDPLAGDPDDESRMDETLIVQLHGRADDARSLVMTRSQYRRHLYSDAAYLTVLRALLATSTVLFLGYSLTDAYLNELRAELVEAFASGDAAQPLAWAVIAGVSEIACSYYARHEGLGVIAYQAGDGGRDHRGFDAILKSLYEQTNPIHRLGELLRGRRVLWFDPQPVHSNLGRELLRAAAADSGGLGIAPNHHLLEVLSLDETCARLFGGGERVDVVISHWGHGLFDTGDAGPDANGAELLRRISARRGAGLPAPPVVIFASPEYAVDNRRRALSLGAAEYVATWEDLMGTLERLLGPPFAR